VRSRRNYIRIEIICEGHFSAAKYHFNKCPSKKAEIILDSLQWREYEQTDSVDESLKRYNKI